MIRSWLASVVFHAGLLAAAAGITTIVVTRKGNDTQPVQIALGGASPGEPGMQGGREGVASEPVDCELTAGEEIDSAECPEFDAPGAVFDPRANSGATGGRVVEERSGAPRASGARGDRRRFVPGGGGAGGKGAGSGTGSGTATTAGSGDGDGGGGSAGVGRRSGGRAPAYPSRARREGWEGTVTLELAVSATGSVSGATVVKSSGHEILDDAALSAAETWTFEPATRDGVPSDARIRMPVTFRLTD